MSKSAFPFSRKNYLFLFLGLALICLGFIVMGMDNEPHGNGFLGLTLGPVLTLSGFIIEFFAIFVKPSKP